MKNFTKKLNELSPRELYLFAFYYFSMFNYNSSKNRGKVFLEKKLCSCFSPAFTPQELTTLKNKLLCAGFIFESGYYYSSYLQITHFTYEEHKQILANPHIVYFAKNLVLCENSPFENPVLLSDDTEFNDSKYNFAKLIWMMMQQDEMTAPLLDNELSKFNLEQIEYLRFVFYELFDELDRCPAHLGKMAQYMFYFNKLDHSLYKGENLNEILQILPESILEPVFSHSAYFLYVILTLKVCIAFLMLDVKTLGILRQICPEPFVAAFYSFLQGKNLKTSFQHIFSKAEGYGMPYFYYLVVALFLGKIAYQELRAKDCEEFRNIYNDEKLGGLYGSLANYKETLSFAWHGIPEKCHVGSNSMLKAVLYSAVHCLPNGVRPPEFESFNAAELADYAVAIADRGYNFPALIMLTALKDYLKEGSLAAALLGKLEGMSQYCPSVRSGYFPDRTKMLIEELSGIFHYSENKSASALPSKKSRLQWVITVESLNDGLIEKKYDSFYELCNLKGTYNTVLKNGNYSVCKNLEKLLENDQSVIQEYFSEEDYTLLEQLRDGISLSFRTILAGKENIHFLISDYENRYMFYGYNFDAACAQPPCELLLVKPGVQMTTEKDGSLKLTALFPVTSWYNKMSRKKETVLFKKINDRLWHCIFWNTQAKQLFSAFSKYGVTDKDGRCSLIFPENVQEKFKELVPSIAALCSVEGEAVTCQTENMEHQPGEVALVLVIRGDEENQEYELTLRNQICQKNNMMVPIAGGDDSIIVECEGRQIVIDRQRKEETDAAKKFEMQCSVLEEAGTGKYRWSFSSLEQLLQLLEEMAELENPPIIDWQGMKPLTCRKAECSFHVKSGLAWFDIGGDVQVDEKRIMELSQLLELMPDNKKSNFISVGDRKYIHLTAQMRAALEAMKVGIAVKGEVRIGNGALPAFQSKLPDNFQKVLPEKFVERLKRLGEALNAEPELPNGLQCTLRQYQVTGYQWLARMASADIGVCLADDMGVGKTLQLLAMLLARGKYGPSLVFAPASVCRNWQLEAEKFTRGLVLTQLGEMDRLSAVNNAGPYDVLVVSYGLLPTCAELLQSRKWNCMVLDEAQAIKNFQSKRSQLVKGIEAASRIAATGTPVENNLFEFWNMFDFLNPGMLGGHDGFQKRWMDGNTLKPKLKLVTSPLILRRMKADVLSELPGKTEINLEVQLSDTERHLYETLRREAKQAIAESGNTGGKAAMQILAQLTRLRRFCCHPTLVLPEVAEGEEVGSKIRQLMELAEDLKESGHPALVFSQYVDMLTIVRRYFDEAGFSYCYLDGSTPAKKRQSIVDDFQHGNKDFFLISLKAGGLGLNLTAASYVILMDPWWNPAVENQAADRVYRIGQHNPVTIYRLFAKDTVEERVLELQEQKKLLADELLEGSTAENRLSPELMMQLLND